VARKTVVVSDMSGKQIAEGKGAKVRITFDDARSGSIEMDVTAEEARAMGAKGRPVARRGPAIAPGTVARRRRHGVSGPLIPTRTPVVPVTGVTSA